DCLGPAPARRAPLPGQDVGNIRPIMMCAPGGSAVEDLVGVYGDAKIGIVARVEFLAPERYKLGALRLGKHASLEQIALLAVVAGPLQAQSGGLIAPPRHWTVTVGRPQPHYDIAAANPGVAQFLLAAKQRAA